MLREIRHNYFSAIILQVLFISRDRSDIFIGGGIH